ncbi:MAG: hypothetical protein SOZ34_06960, partial [Clostridia bacterium]|nr:hypothetical protein [Clostridia bacterium]
MAKLLLNIGNGNAYETMGRVVAKKNTNVYPEAMEKAENKGGKPEEIWYAREWQAYRNENTRKGCWAVAGSADFAEHVAVKDKNLAQKILDVIRDILDKIGVKKYSEMDNIARAWEKAVNTAQRNVNNVNSSTKNTGNGKIQYSLSKFAERDVNYALTNKNYTEDVYLTESSPSIIVNQKGTKNLPMVMKASHIRENV